MACEIIAQWCRNSEDTKILVTAETNEAVNNIMLKLLGKGFDKQKVLRLGFSENITNADVNQFTLEKLYMANYRAKRLNELGMEKKKVVRLINRVQVVFATCSSTMLAYLDDMVFKCLLVDEAGQVFEPALLMPLSRGSERMCLIGDHKQLPPLVKNAVVKEELGKTMFERLMQLRFIQTTMLNVQFRMSPDIAAFPAHCFYEGKLTNAAVTQTDRKGVIFPGQKVPKSIAFIDVKEGMENRTGLSKSNVNEAQLIKHLIGLVKSLDTSITEVVIGVITAYEGQVKLLKQILKEFKGTVNTVDGFQGQERQVILYSAVRANKCQDVGFLSDEKRFNVAMTRAKRLLVVIGNSQTLKADKLWKKWIDWIINNNHQIHI